MYGPQQPDKPAGPFNSPSPAPQGFGNSGQQNPQGGQLGGRRFGNRKHVSIIGTLFIIILIAYWGITILGTTTRLGNAVQNTYTSTIYNPYSTAVYSTYVSTIYTSSIYQTTSIQPVNSTLANEYTTTVPPAGDSVSCAFSGSTQVGQSGWYGWDPNRSALFGMWENNSVVGYSECYGMPYTVDYGMQKSFLVNASKTLVSFDWRAKSSTSLSIVTNLNVLLASQSQSLNYTLVSGGAVDTGWQHFSILLNTTNSTQFLLSLYTRNAWSAYYAQQVFISNVTLTNVA